MTTRKLAVHLVCMGILSAFALGGGGCATPGPLHVYSLDSGTAANVTDTGPAPAGDVSSFLAPGDTVTGFAYDPFTDHFFLRLAPGNGIRVVDRPARAVKREFDAAHAPATGGGDLAVRPRDGHLFLTLPDEAALLELTRFGEFVRRIPLDHPTRGVAFDAKRDQLWVLDAKGFNAEQISLDGKKLTTVPLGQAVEPTALAYDAEQHELYARLATKPAIGVFDERGQLLRVIPSDAQFLDVGPRSFLRLF